MIRTDKDIRIIQRALGMDLVEFTALLVVRKTVRTTRDVLRDEFAAKRHIRETLVRQVMAEFYIELQREALEAYHDYRRESREMTYLPSGEPSTRAGKLLGKLCNILRNLPLPEIQHESFKSEPEREAESRLDQLFLEAFETNDPAMQDYVALKFELKQLREIERKVRDYELRPRPDAVEEEQVGTRGATSLPAKDTPAREGGE